MTNNTYPLHFYNLFNARFFRLYTEVKELKKANTPDLKNHPKVKLYLSIVDTFKKLKEKSAHKKHALKESSSLQYTDLHYEKYNLPSEYKMFFKYFSTHSPPDMLIVCLANAITLKQQHAKAECHTLFKRLGNGKQISSSYDKLADNNIVYE